MMRTRERIHAVLSVLWTVGLLKLAWKAQFAARKEARRIWYTFLVSRQAGAVGTDLQVNGKTRVRPQTALGDNVNFNRLEVRGDGSLRIGDNFHSGPDCRIMTRNHDFDGGDAIPYDDTYVRDPVRIGDNIWFGAGVTVVPGVEIEEGAIVQAGSTVVDDVPKGAIVGGHPATVIRYRDLDHYDRLKELGRFH